MQEREIVGDGIVEEVWRAGDLKSKVIDSPIVKVQSSDDRQRILEADDDVSVTITASVDRKKKITEVVFDD